MKTMKWLASRIAKIEGKKSQTRVGDVREILGIISDLLFRGELEEFYLMFQNNGVKRANKRSDELIKLCPLTKIKRKKK